MNPSTKLYVILALTILIWGNSFVVVQLAINDGATPIMIAMGRFLVASTIFGGYILFRRPKGIDRADLRLFLALAFVSIGVYYFFQYYGIHLAGPSITSILITLLCPIMIFMLSYFRLGERISAEQKLGLGISAAGSYLVITDGTTEFISDWESVLGGAFAVICAALWAYYTVEGKKVVKKYDPFVSTAYIALMGTAMLVPSAVAEVQLSGSVSMTLGYVAAVLYLGILCTVIGYVYWFRALTGLTASSTGATLFFEPVVTVVFAWIILGQGIGWVAAAGGVLVLVGVALVSRR
ncbi:MAG: DMT family transporter [Candidatus Thermoplasmatota archaeon]|nr:DMT family transporter [Candidatus Thermoplasmatota archaeon]